ncbi:hypothetical protein EVAR_41398_1 [Eumeta japonica]|uniref:Reverse transcriptase domain-containing protein n=1 Tax=Eumeta variegata TaxID=151549 RepID=A0A4C1WXW9_EUMVA|nr:hypothetical protein EVAR_41398_1 [Eumeta japonica]
MDELSVKCLLQADDQVSFAPSSCELEAMQTKMDDSVEKRSMKVNISKTKVREVNEEYVHTNQYCELFNVFHPMELNFLPNRRPIFI